MSRACCQRLENTMALASGGPAACRQGLALNCRGGHDNKKCAVSRRLSHCKGTQKTIWPLLMSHHIA